VRTGRQQHRSNARHSGYDHAETKRPSATPSIHYNPTSHVTGNLGERGKQKTQMFLVPQCRPVVRKTDVYHVVGEPNRDKIEPFYPHMRCVTQIKSSKECHRIILSKRFSSLSKRFISLSSYLEVKLRTDNALYTNVNFSSKSDYRDQSLSWTRVRI